jgi:hypothetical protein
MDEWRALGAYLLAREAMRVETEPGKSKAELAAVIHLLPRQSSAHQQASA